MKQFPTVATGYGASMGRHEFGIPSLEDKCRLFKMRLNSGGYDDGGAYWGSRQYGESLFCLECKDGGIRRFYTAKNRKIAFAMALEQFPELVLINGYNLPDGRYSTDKEYYGKALDKYMFRFCDVLVSAQTHKIDARNDAWMHWLERVK